MLFSQFAFHSLLVTHWNSLVTRCKIRSLLVTKVTRCKSSLVNRGRSCSLKKITRYLLQNSLVTRCISYSLQKLTRYSLQNSFVTRGKSCSLQKSLVTCCEICLLLVVTNHSLLVAKNYLSIIKTITSS